MKLNNIIKTYHNKNNSVDALKGITLEIEENGITVILGASGCGKTTLLNCIAGRESFEGSIDNVSNFDYLTQDFNLFEEMSVWDNLCLVSDDFKLIRHYLKEFDLKEQKKKKVKKLSNGQKKRVQFIRALLHKPGLLLCDEPTASLDHDNAVLLMEELRKISSDVQIILVTHDTLLAQQYADRIITMDQGIVVKDEKKNSNSYTQIGEEIPNRKLDDTLILVIREIRSRIMDSLSQVILIVLCVLSIFITLNLYTNVSNQSDYQTTFKNAENMVVSVPKEKEANNGETVSGYATKYTGLTIDDLFDYSSIQQLINDTPEIIGVESYNSFQYQQDEELEYAKGEFDKQAYYHFTYNDMDLVNYPMETPYLLPSSFQSDLKWINYMGSDYLSYPKYLVQCFDLVNGYSELPLLCGSYPEGDSVLLSKNAADLLMELDNYSSYEDLVGKTVKLALQGYQNNYYLEIDGQAPIDIIEVTISGVSSVENDYTTMVFFNNGYGNNPVYNHYVTNKDAIKMEYVRFILKPGCDYNSVSEKISQYFNKTNVDITLFKGKGLGKDKEFYQSPAGLAIYGLIVLGIVVAMLVISILFKKKRLVKEKNIMSIYGYSPIKESILRYLIFMILSLILVVLVARPISTSINTFASAHYYQPFMTYNNFMSIGITVFVSTIMIVLEMIVSGRRYDSN